MPSFFNIEKIRGLLSQTLNDDKFAASMFHPGGNRRSIVDSVMDARSTDEVNTNADLLHAVAEGMADYLRGYPSPASYK